MRVRPRRAAVGWRAQHTAFVARQAAVPPPPPEVPLGCGSRGIDGLVGGTPALRTRGGRVHAHLVRCHSRAAYVTRAASMFWMILREETTRAPGRSCIRNACVLFGLCVLVLFHRTALLCQRTSRESVTTKYVFFLWCSCSAPGLRCQRKDASRGRSDSPTSIHRMRPDIQVKAPTSTRGAAKVAFSRAKTVYCESTAILPTVHIAALHCITRTFLRAVPPVPGATSHSAGVNAELA